MPMDLSGYRYAETIVEHLPVGVALVDAQNFCLLTANPLYYTFLDPGWQEGQALGRPVNEWIPDAEETGVMTIFRTVAETGISYRVDTYPFPALARGVTYWNWALEPLRDTDGHIRYLLLTVSDITAQVQARQHEARSQEISKQEKGTIEEERQRLSVIKSVARGMQISNVVKRRCRAIISTLAANFSVQEIFVHIAEIESAQFYLVDRYPDVSSEADLSIRQSITYENVLPGGRLREPFMVNDLQKLKGEQLRSRLYPFIQTRARGYLCVPLWFEERLEGLLTATFSTPIRNGSPEVEALLAGGEQISSALALGRGQSVIEHEREHLHFILDQLPEGVVIIDAITGTISYANARASLIIGMPHEELIGFPFRFFSRNADLQDPGGQLAISWTFPAVRALTGETINSLETVVVKPDGSHLEVCCSSAPLRVDADTITGAIIVFQESTGRTALEEEKDLFLSLMSHELRTPMTVIIGYIELLEMLIAQGDGLDIMRLQQVFSRLNQQSDYLAHLIEELLEIAHIAAGQVEIQTDLCDLWSILQQVVESMTIASEQQQITLEPGLPASDPIMIYCDEHQITRVFTNLIGNALKYSQPDKNVSVTLFIAEDNPHEVVCQVEDQGVGISEEELDRIFARFYRTAKARSLTSGLGIGLYVVKEIVTAHGGRIWVESVPGQGSTFSIALPLVFEDKEKDR